MQCTIHFQQLIYTTEIILHGNSNTITTRSMAWGLRSNIHKFNIFKLSHTLTHKTHGEDNLTRELTSNMRLVQATQSFYNKP